MFRVERQIVRNVHVFEDLLRDATKNRRRNLSSLMKTNRRVKNDRDNDLWVVQRCKTCEGGVVLGLRIGPSRRINLLPGSRLSPYGIAVEQCPAGGALQNDLLHHGAHLGGCKR